MNAREVVSTWHARGAFAFGKRRGYSLVKATDSCETTGSRYWCSWVSRAIALTVMQKVRNSVIIPGGPGLRPDACKLPRERGMWFCGKRAEEKRQEPSLPDAVRKLAERVEELVSAEHANWINETQRAASKKQEGH